MQILRVISDKLMNIHFLNYPHGANSRDIVRVIWTFLYALDTILTYGYSCLGLKSKNELMLRINISPDGHTQWTFYLILSIFASEGNSNHNLMNTNDG